MLGLRFMLLQSCTMWLVVTIKQISPIPIREIVSKEKAQKRAKHFPICSVAQV